MFNPFPNFYMSSAWSGSEIDPGVYFNLFILNNSGFDVDINKVYIKNRISNPQELNHIENFCITIGSDNSIYNSTDVNTITILEPSDNYSFAYPSYYNYRPGEQVYENLIYTSTLINYKYEHKFRLASGSRIPLRFNFNPKYRKIDFYLADLIIEYVSSVNPVVQIIKHRVEAEYVNIVSEIDKTSYPELIVSVNGVLKGDILTVE